jgi:hypothetical protein
MERMTETRKGNGRRRGKRQDLDGREGSVEGVVEGTFLVRLRWQG